MRKYAPCSMLHRSIENCSDLCRKERYVALCLSLRMVLFYLHPSMCFGLDSLHYTPLHMMIEWERYVYLCNIPLYLLELIWTHWDEFRKDGNNVQESLLDQFATFLYPMWCCCAGNVQQCKQKYTNPYLLIQALVTNFHGLVTITSYPINLNACEWLLMWVVIVCTI